MSYRVQDKLRVSVQRNVTQSVHITNTEARAKNAGRRPRGKARTRDTEPFLIRAIARELSKFEGGRIVEHLTGARQLLEDAFRAVEQKNGLAALCDASPHAT